MSFWSRGIQVGRSVQGSRLFGHTPVGGRETPIGRMKRFTHWVHPAPREGDSPERSSSPQGISRFVDWTSNTAAGGVAWTSNTAAGGVAWAGSTAGGFIDATVDATEKVSPLPPASPLHLKPDIKPHSIIPGDVTTVSPDWRATQVKTQVLPGARQFGATARTTRRASTSPERRSSSPEGINRFVDWAGNTAGGGLAWAGSTTGGFLDATEKVRPPA